MQAGCSTTCPDAPHQQSWVERQELLIPQREEQSCTEVKKARKRSNHYPGCPAVAMSKWMELMDSDPGLGNVDGQDGGG